MAQFTEPGKYQVPVDQIADLLCQETPIPTPKNQTLWMSLALPFQRTEDLFVQHTKSALQQTLRRHSEAEKHANAAQTVLEYVLPALVEWREDQVAQPEEHAAGLITYFAFNPEEIHHISASEIGEKTHLFLSSVSTPVEEVWSDIGYCYHLAPVFSALQQRVRNYTLIIAEEESLLYRLENTAHEQLERWENKYGTEAHNRYREQMTVTRDKSVTHGTGSEKVDRQQESGNRLYLQTIFERCLEILQADELATGVQIFYPVDMSDMVETYAHDILDANIDVPLELEAKVVSAERYDFAAAVEELEQQQRQSVTDIVAFAQSKKHFLTEKSAVVEALRDHQLQYLFVFPELAIPGYVSDDGLVFAEEVENSFSTDNLIPWMLRTSYEAATLVITGEPVANTDIEVAGLPRYVAE